MSKNDKLKIFNITEETIKFYKEFTKEKTKLNI